MRESDHVVRRYTVQLHDVGELLVLAFTREEREAGEKLRHDGPKRPHVNRRGVRNTKNDLWRPVEPRLDIGVYPLAHEATAPIVNDLNTRLVLLLQQNILRLQVAMDQ